MQNINKEQSQVSRTFFSAHDLKNKINIMSCQKDKRYLTTKLEFLHSTSFKFADAWRMNKGGCDSTQGRFRFCVRFLDNKGWGDKRELYFESWSGSWVFRKYQMKL